MDISYCKGGQKFNYRVAGLLLHENQILAMRDERSPYYYLPGGRVKLGETAEQAILREIREELNLEAQIDRPLWVHQSFFTEDVDHLRYHELCFYFLMDFTGTDLLGRGETFWGAEVHHQQVFEWLDISKLKETYFYPLFLKEKASRLPQNLELLTTYESDTIGQV